MLQAYGDFTEISKLILGAVTSYTTDTYTITPCEQASAAPSSKPDCKIYFATGDVFVVFSNKTVPYSAQDLRVSSFHAPPNT